MTFIVPYQNIKLRMVPNLNGVVVNVIRDRHSESCGRRSFLKNSLARTNRYLRARSFDDWVHKDRRRLSTEGYGLALQTLTVL